MTSLLRALRNLRRDPDFALLALITLALGLTATVTIFTLVNGVLLRPLPYPESDRLVDIDHEALALQLEQMGLSDGLYFYYLDRSQAFEELALYNQTEVTLTGEGSPERVDAINATPSLFRALGVAPRLGRAFSEEEGRPGAPDVALLSDALWRSRYGGDPGVVGRTIEIKGMPHEVVGVMPEGFAYPDDTQLFLARQVDRSTANIGSFSDSGLARLRGDVSLEAADTELAALIAGLAEAFPEERAVPILEQAGFRALVRSELESVVGNVSGVLWVLLGTVAVILAIACANVANLFLVRVEERSNERAVRTALGASRWRLIGEQVVEGIALGLIAGAVSLGLSAIAVELVKRYGPGDIPRLDQVGLDARVLLFALALSVVTGAALGGLSALRGVGHRLTLALKEGGRTTVGKEKNRLRSALVASQVALGLVLLIGCGLLLRSLDRIAGVDPGFVPEGRLSFNLSLPQVKYPTGEDRARFAERLIERLEALPGVNEAGVVSYLPLTGTASGAGYTVEGHETADEALPQVFMHANASPGYFEALGVRLLEGRTFEPADHRNRSGSVIVTETLADSLWPGDSAIGKRIVQGVPETAEDWYTIVGVVNELRVGGLESDPTPMVFKPLLGIATEEEEHGDSDDLGLGMSLVLRTEVAPESLASAVRSEVWALDPDLPITRLMPMREIVRDAKARMSFTVAVLGIASAMALLIAAVGLYGVISYVVSRRRHEIGVRMALGASRRSVGRLVLRQGLVVGVVGIAVGLGLAAAATRLLDSLLFGVGRLDPVTFLAVPLVLLAVVLVASWLPARRATRVDPLVALRYE